MGNNLLDMKEYHIEHEELIELRNFLEKWRKYAETIDWEQAYKDTEQHFCRFTEQTGFIVPMNWQPGEIKEFPISSKKDGEKILLDYYKTDNNANLNQIFDEIKEIISKNNTKWNSLIADCLLCYENKFFKPIVPSLVSIIEGIIAEPCNINNDYKNKINTYCQKQGFDGSFTRIIWTSIGKYFDNLYKYKKFSEERPNSLNRHWIQHGRDNSELWREIDVIQLFCALHAMLTVTYR